MQMEKYDPKKEDGCTQGERSINDSEDVQCEEETNVFPIPLNKFTRPGTKDHIKGQLLHLRQTLDEFYHIANNIKTMD
tara:strand:- start:238 stop:471 length:234 start_codon:yes stop_codon:yes gene_type:complete